MLFCEHHIELMNVLYTERTGSCLRDCLITLLKTIIGTVMKHLSKCQLSNFLTHRIRRPCLKIKLIAHLAIVLFFGPICFWSIILLRWKLLDLYLSELIWISHLFSPPRDLIFWLLIYGVRWTELCSSLFLDLIGSFVREFLCGYCVTSQLLVIISLFWRIDRVIREIFHLWRRRWYLLLWGLSSLIVTLMVFRCLSFLVGSLLPSLFPTGGGILSLYHAYTEALLYLIL